MLLRTCSLDSGSPQPLLHLSLIHISCAAHVLSEGANNLYVGVLQIGLYAHNITLNSGIDNDFGPSTKQGVIKFQSSQGLAADGMAGRDTFARLADV